MAVTFFEEKLKKMRNGKFSKVKYIFSVLILLSVVLGLAGESNRVAFAEDNGVSIGVLARRGAQESLRVWLPTAQYLTDQIPGTVFKIVPLAFEEVTPAVEGRKVDFIVVNPSIYTEMQVLYNVSRMATIKRTTPDGYSTLFGGVIFCRSDRRQIDSLKDLNGKSFMAVDETSFGGWRVAWREFKKSGVNPYKDFASLAFVGTHDDVIYAVRDRKADAGTVATSILEQMIAEGKIAPDTFKVINRQQHAGFPYACSTHIYPEWPFARLKHTPDPLAEKVAIALLGMPAQSPAARAANCSGWTVPLDYESVDDCLKELCVGIYKDYGKITLALLINSYRWQILSGVAATAILIGLLLFTLQLNRKLRISKHTLQEEMAERRHAEKTLSETLTTLEGTVREVKQRNGHITLINEMGDLLQSCLTREEAYAGIITIIPQLFPDLSGTLFMLSPRKSLLIEAVARWGEAPSAGNVFTADQCLALRRGEIHLARAAYSGLRCKHIMEDQPTEYMCVPMVAQGEIIGLLSLQSSLNVENQASGGEAGCLTEIDQHIAVTVAKQISLAIANLNLRENLHLQAIVDPLTGLFNRRYLKEAFDREIHRANRRNMPVGVMIIDLDHFKRINDSFGHDAGDLVLVTLAGLLKKNIRQEDISCRYGGEEFLVILPEMATESTLQRAEKLREIFRQLEVKHMGASLGVITASFGVASYPAHGKDLEEIVRAADAALYRAKEQGRDRVVVA